MQKDFSKISIVTPNYNYANFVSETIESILGQNYPEIEHVIVDDGSTDNSVDVIQSFVSNFPTKVRLIRQENRGQTPAINRGLAAAKGDILGWINSDDTYCHNVFPEVAELFLDDPKVDIVFGDVNVVDMKGRFIYRIRHLDFNYVTACFLGFGRVTTSNAIFWRRRAFERSGQLNENLHSNMDGEFYSRLFKDSKVRRIPIPIANFRVHSTSKSSERSETWKSTYQREVALELEQSYNRLLISQYLPLQHRFAIAYLFRVGRIFRRAIRGHYVSEFLETFKYKLRKHSQ